MSKYIRYTYLWSKYLIIQGTFETLCLISSECRAIRQDCESKGEEIDPLVSVCAEIENLHDEIFGR